MAQKALETYTTLNNLFKDFFLNHIQLTNQLIDELKEIASSTEQ